GDRRRRRRLFRPLLAGEARLGGRRPDRARRPDEWLDVPFGGPRRAAPELVAADEDDDGQRRALSRPRVGGRARYRLARGWLAAARLLAGTTRGDHTPGRLGEDVRSAARADL